jgi:hypothetical protein
MIQTPNLQLLPVERIHVEALLRSKSELAALLQVTVPDGWPHFPEAFPSLLMNPTNPISLRLTGRDTFFFIRKTECLLVAELSKVHLTTQVRSR